MSLPNRRHARNPPVPKLFPLPWRPGFEWDAIARGVQPAPGGTPTRRPRPRPCPGAAFAKVRGGAPGNLTWRRPGAGFPRGIGLLRGDNRQANRFPWTLRLNPPQALPLQVISPLGSSEKGFTRNSSFPAFHRGSVPARRCSSPPPRRVAPQPPPGLSSWYPKPRVPSPGRAVPGCSLRPRNALGRSPPEAHQPGGRGPQLRGAVRPLPRGKGTGSLSQSPANRLSTPQGARRGVPRPSAAPPSSCHHSPALQGLTFEFVIGFGLFVKLLPDFEIRHDPRFRLHGSRFPAFYCWKVRTEPGGGGKVVRPGSPERCAPAQCRAQPLARARPPAPARWVYTRTRAGGAGGRALPGICSSIRAGHSRLAGGAAPAKTTAPRRPGGGWSNVVDTASATPVRIHCQCQQLLSLLSPGLLQGYGLGYLILIRRTQPCSPIVTPPPTSDICEGAPSRYLKKKT